jgi:ferric-dicitrate binding protein FerR (iron transport regulator)
MHTQYHTPEDFINDDEFVNWVLQPNENSESYWSKFIVAHPNKVALIDEARDFLLLMHFRDAKPDDRSIIKMKSNIDLAIAGSSQDANDSLIFYKNTWFKIAAVFVIFAIASVLTLMSQKGNDAIRFIAQTPAPEQDVTIQTAKGKRSVITLDDSTQVWLNADSKIVYSKKFLPGEKRIVFLEGEAFFDVAEDKSRPFVVNASGMSVVVLGTAFNVKAFKNDPSIETTLLRGEVAIQTGNNQKENITLRPNQQAVYVKKSKQVILENHVEAADYASWKEGQLYFKDETFKTIAQELERWYDIEITISDKRSENCRFSANMNNKTLEEVLELFATSESSFKYEVRGKEVSVIGNFCSE